MEFIINLLYFLKYLCLTGGIVELCIFIILAIFSTGQVRKDLLESRNRYRSEHNMKEDEEIPADAGLNDTFIIKAYNLCRTNWYKEFISAFIFGILLAIF